MRVAPVAAEVLGPIGLAVAEVAPGGSAAVVYDVGKNQLVAGERVTSEFCLAPDNESSEKFTRTN